ncbi:MAG: retropepsin-like aspartic protease [Mariniphaga sp.]
MKIKVDLQFIELEDDNLHLVVASGFKSGETGNWIIDTGASRTVFDLNLESLYRLDGEETDQLHTAGIGDKTIKTAVGRLSDFTLGKLTVENLRVALIDLSHINRFYAQAAGMQICGLLGSDFLLLHKAVIDFDKKLLILKTLRK